ncbi:unnamed protein product, partial [Discosporangium mesarthrocarpum]
MSSSRKSQGKGRMKSKGKCVEFFADKRTTGLGIGKNPNPRGRRRKNKAEGDESDDDKVKDPVMERLWGSRINPYLRPLRKTDTSSLKSIQQSVLKKWDIPEEMVKNTLLKRDQSGTDAWLNPLIGRKEFLEAVKSYIPSAKASLKLRPLGKSYKAVWAEEDARHRKEMCKETRGLDQDRK